MTKQEVEGAEMMAALQVVLGKKYPSPETNYRDTIAWYATALHLFISIAQAAGRTREKTMEMVEKEWDRCAPAAKKLFKTTP